MSEDRKAARGPAGWYFSAGLGCQDWLAALLRDVTGIDDVVTEKRPDADAWVMVRTGKALPPGVRCAAPLMTAAASPAGSARP